MDNGNNIFDEIKRAMEERRVYNIKRRQYQLSEEDEYCSAVIDSFVKHKDKYTTD